MSKFRKDIKRIYHPYETWEEVKFGMWSDIPKELEQEKLQETINFMNDTEKFGDHMIFALDVMKKSCENSLSFKGMNRIAFMGQAACCLGVEAPESVTRQAWSYLTEEKRQEANEKAEIAIAKWEDEYYDKAYAEYRCSDCFKAANRMDI